MFSGKLPALRILPVLGIIGFLLGPICYELRLLFSSVVQTDLNPEEPPENANTCFPIIFKKLYLIDEIISLGRKSPAN